MLSVELLQRIFARLPLPDIIGLRVLSKTWDRYVTGATPGFTQLCAERHPNMFALISEGDCYYEKYPNGPVVINPYDSEGKKWHPFVHETYGLESCETMCAGDGGLVFLVSTLRGPFPMIMVVFNPLTRQWRTLPTSSSLSSIRPRMVQLVMDRDSKGYKVLVVGPKTQGGDPVARIFSSATGKWSKPNIVSDLIFGWQYRWHDGPGHGMVTGKKAGPCAYDCATRTLLELDGGGYPCRHGDQRVLVKDRLFVLHFKSFHDRYVLKEYQFQRGLPQWVKLKDHECYELNYVYGGQGTVALDTQLFGCQNYLVVFACQACQTADECTNRIALLFDLSTCEWQIISEVPGWHQFHHHSSCDMFELRWDAVP